MYSYNISHTATNQIACSGIHTVCAAGPVMGAYHVMHAAACGPTSEGGIRLSIVTCEGVSAPWSAVGEAWSPSNDHTVHTIPL